MRNAQHMHVIYTKRPRIILNHFAGFNITYSNGLPSGDNVFSLLPLFSPKLAESEKAFSRSVFPAWTNVDHFGFYAASLFPGKASADFAGIEAHLVLVRGPLSN